MHFDACGLSYCYYLGLYRGDYFIIYCIGGKLLWLRSLATHVDNYGILDSPAGSMCQYGCRMHITLSFYLKYDSTTHCFDNRHFPFICHYGRLRCHEVIAVSHHHRKSLRTKYWRERFKTADSTEIWGVIERKQLMWMEDKQKRKHRHKRTADYCWGHYSNE